MLKIINANELNYKYNVNGNFYKVQLENNHVIDCRNVLDITNKAKTPMNTNSLLNMIPNAIFIMMNPGGSKLLTDKPKVIQFKKIDELKIQFAKTQPDKTQYQLMRIMLYTNWSHIRILNLSDLINTYSGDFYYEFNKIEVNHNYHSHSIFNNSRENEFNTLFKTNENTKVICAWGVNTKLNPLINQCLDKIKEFNYMGLKKFGSEDKLFHPLPRRNDKQIEWVNKMLNLIKN